MSILKNIANYSEKQKKLSSCSLIEINVGVVYSTISGNLSDKLLTKIDKVLSIADKSAKYSKAYKANIWDGRIRFFKTRTGSFPTGLLGYLTKLLDKKNVKYKIKDNRPKHSFTKKNIRDAIDEMKQMNINPRNYQIQPVINVLLKKQYQGVINLPTGSGKTLIMNLLTLAIRKYDRNMKVIVIASGITLLSQLSEEFKKFQGQKPYTFGSTDEFSSQVCLASVDTIYSRMKKKETKYETLKFLEQFSVVFCDEAHTASTTSFKNVLCSIPASIRIGFTATYMRSDGGIKLLKAVTGKLIYRKTLSWMIKRNYLAKPVIIMFNFSGKERTNDERKQLFTKYLKSHNQKPPRTDVIWSQNYTVDIVLNKKRNKLLAQILRLSEQNNFSTVMFVNNLFHGKSILKKVDDCDVVFLKGADKETLVRQPTLKKFRAGELRSIISTRILGVGVDFPEANVGIRASGMKFKGNIIQNLGRIIRKTKPKGSNDIDLNQRQYVFWIDINDTHNGLLQHHSNLRRTVYLSQPEFIYKEVSTVKELKQIFKKYKGEVNII